MRALSRIALVSLCLAPLAIAGCPGPAPSDAGMGDAPPPFDGGGCTGDTECDDGLYCTGVERCVMGSCAYGAPIACDDGIECTRDRCSESRRACESSAPDLDGDGHGAVGCATGDDCDDADANRFPGNPELCDELNHDEDCDGTTGGDLDEDGDGFVSARCCNGTSCGPDCDDARGTVRPDGIETCNGLDDDCSGMIDEGQATTVYVDQDRDGYGAGAAMMLCGDTVGFATEAGDCDDTPGAGISRSPGQPEFCDRLDNDCDMRVDEMASEVPWYPDADGDGFGEAGSTPVVSCIPVADHSLRDTDCDDATASVGPASLERCNGFDDDCNGRADAVIEPGDFEDDDGDGLADLRCGVPAGVDCDDSSAAVGTGGAELCDGRDNDCDDIVDEGAMSAIFFRDVDGDGFGSEASGTVVSCSGPADFVLRGGDCDDASTARFPGATETCDARDDDCDGTLDESPASLSCDLPNARSVCLPSVGCAVLSCDPGFSACGGPGPGCNVDLRSDALNCGECGRTCSTAGVMGAPSCAAGRCALPACLAGFGDCNVEGRDGCESMLDMDRLNCGACGRNCPSGPFQVASCNVGVCAAACVAGRFDCDGRADNGCESTSACTSCGPGLIDCDGMGSCIDLNSNASHCGTCGRSCGVAGTCAGGTCDRVVEVVTGLLHTCARREGGGVLCWGDGVAGSGGASPAAVALPAPAVELASARDAVCALLADGRVYCWGNGPEGQLGTVDLSAPPSAPVAVSLPFGGPWHLSAGSDHFVAWTANGPQFVGWGSNASGQIDDLPKAPPLFRYATGVTFAVQPVGLSNVLTGDRYSCALGAGPMPLGSCVGVLGGVDAAGTTVSLIPFAMPDLPFGASLLGSLVHGGDGFGCISTVSSGVHCGGDPRTIPAMGLSSSTFVTAFLGTPIVGRVGGGHDTTCAIDALSRLRCHGANATWQLGTSTTSPTDFVAGVLPTGLPRVGVVSDGAGGHNCAVDLGGRLWCWGANDANQCGIVGAARVAPTVVSGL